MSSLIEQVISYGAVAVLAAFVTYIFSVRTTKKGKLYDAKLEVYSKILGHFQDAIINLEGISNLQDYDLSDEEAFMANYMNLSGELTGLGDIEVLTLYTDQKRLTKMLKEKGTEGFLEWLQSRAILLNSTNFVRGLSEVRFRAGQLKLVDPPERVRKAFEAVLETIASGGVTIVQKITRRFPEAFEGVDLPEEFEKEIKKPEERTEEIQRVLLELVTAMQEDLGKTL